MLLSDYVEDYHPDEIIMETFLQGVQWYVNSPCHRHSHCLSLPPNLVPGKKVYALYTGVHYVYLREADRYEVWEVWEHNGATEKIAKITSCLTRREAILEAVRCQRPDIEVITPEGRFISHSCNADGSWAI